MMKRQNWNKMRIIGTRTYQIIDPFSKEWADFIDLLIQIRGKDAPFVPRGVYKFKTFREAEKWRIPMMLGQRPRAIQPE